MALVISVFVVTAPVAGMLDVQPQRMLPVWQPVTPMVLIVIPVTL